VDTKDGTRELMSGLASILAVTVGLFHILEIAGVFALSTMIVRIFHLMMMLAIAFLQRPLSRRASGTWIDYAIRIIGVGLALLLGAYMLTRWKDFAESGGVNTRFDLLVSVAMILLVIEGARRSVGLVIALVAALFLLYPFIGPYLPGLLNARRYSAERIFTFLSISSEGVYGIPVGVSATYIIMFCMYGAFLNEFGVGDFLYNLSKTLTRKMTAAAAKTSVVFSATVGMISGSAAGNVAVTGVFTIPMMKRSGYPAHEAGAVEAIASTGGQIMPPIMGAAAFIMAEIIGQPYVRIMRAALIPALLYFVSIFMVVHLVALRRGIRAEIDRSEAIIPVGDVLRTGWFFLVPIVGLIAMLVSGYSPFRSAFFSIILLLVIYPVWKRRLDRDFLKTCVRAIRNGAMSTVMVATACAAAGIIAGVLSVTGLGSKLSSLIIYFSRDITLIALLLTMLTSLILGMGLPTTAAYIILASVVAPSLVKMGVPLITAHMFVFFYGCISTITPPVALAAYVAGGIAEADVNRVGWTAFRFGLTAYVLPFVFYYGSALLLEGSVLQIAQAIVFALVGVFAIAAGVVGYLKTPISWWLRLILVVIGVMMIFQGYVTDMIGFGSFVAVYAAVSARQARKNKRGGAKEVLSESKSG